MYTQGHVAPTETPPIPRSTVVDFVQLKNDMVIVIDAETISVYKSKNEYFECRDPLITYPPEE
jgi:hypothetical protein